MDSATHESDGGTILESSRSSTDLIDSANNQKHDEEAFNYDDILNHIGQLGKFQLLTSMLLLFPGLFPGVVVMSYTITGYVPKYGCYSEECANATSPWLNPNFTRADMCSRYNINTTSPDLLCLPIDSTLNASQLDNCDTWVYDTSLFQSTVITDFNLTCDKEWMQTLASTVYMIGMLVGGLVLGNMGDIIGRRLSFTINTFALATVMTASAFSPDIWTFCVLRFFCGMGGVFLFSNTFVWGVEAVGKKYRTEVGSLYSVVFSLGSVIFGLIAYFVREWRTLQLIIGIPMFIPVLLYWVLPESIRWLITKKRFDEAKKLIEQAAKMNGKSVPKHLLIIPNSSQLVDEEKSISENVGETNVKEETKAQKDNIFAIFRSPILCIRMFIMFFAWLASIMSFYGITFSAVNLSGDFFINYELSMAVEIPAYFAGIFVMKKVGRRFTLVGSLLITGLACLATGLVPSEPAVYQIICSLTGKFFASISSACHYAYTSELFQTSSRSAVIGLCLAVGRIGSILAPIIADMGKTYGSSVPFIIFAIVNVASSLVCLALPETNNIPLPDTIQEAKDLSKNNLPCFRCGVLG